MVYCTKYNVLIVFIFFVFSQLSCDNKRNTKFESISKEQPKKIMQNICGVNISTYINLGAIPCNSNYPILIDIINTTKTVTTIASKSADCSCISSVDTLKIAPGEHNQLSLYWKTGNGFGKIIQRNIILEMNNNSMIKKVLVSLTGVLTDTVVQPNIIKLGDCKPGQQFEKDIPLMDHRYLIENLIQMSGPNDSVIKQNNKDCSVYTPQIIVPNASDDNYLWTFQASILDLEKKYRLLKRSALSRL